MTSNKLLMPLLMTEAAPKLLDDVRNKQSKSPGVTLTQTTFNLVKNVLGVGILSLPYGVASGTGLIPAVTTTIMLGLYSAWTFFKLGEICDQYDAHTFTELGERVTGSKNFAKLMAGTCTIKTFFACFTYSLVLCDSCTQILVGFGVNIGREQVLPSMTAFVLLPLCMMEDLSFLAYASLLGSGGVAFTLLFMVQRFYDESYLQGGEFYDSVPVNLHPNFQDAPGTFAVYNFQLISILSTAFVAHYNAPKFYEQLADRSPERFHRVCRVSFAIAILVFLAFMVIGYQTFGINSQGNILNNYASNDSLATVARAAMSSSVVFTYPLAFTGLRDGAVDLIGVNVNKTLLTVCLLTLITGLGFVVQDVGLVNAFVGAILGSGIVYGFPGMILIYAEKCQSAEMDWVSYAKSRLTAVLGFLLGLHGAALVLLPMILEF